MKGNILVTVLICVFFGVIFLGFLSYCWYARHVKVGVLVSKAMAPGQRRIGREIQRQGYRGRRDFERQEPFQVPRYSSRGWSRARTRSRPREELRNPDYLIVEEARPGERPRVIRYSPRRVAMFPNYNGEGRNQYRSDSRLQDELEHWNRHDTLRPPEGVITKESIHKWASKTHPNGSGWEALSHGQKGEHHASHHDEKAGSHKKASSWGKDNKGYHNDNQPKGSIQSPKKAASKNGSNAMSTKWTQVSKKNSDWGNSKKSDHNNKDSKKDNQGNDPDPWVSEDRPKVRIKKLTVAGLKWNVGVITPAHKMRMSVQSGRLNLLAEGKLRRQGALVRRYMVASDINLITEIYRWLSLNDNLPLPGV